MVFGFCPDFRLLSQALPRRALRDRISVDEPDGPLTLAMIEDGNRLFPSLPVVSRDGGQGFPVSSFPLTIAPNATVRSLWQKSRACDTRRIHPS